MALPKEQLSRTPSKMGWRSSANLRYSKRFIREYHLHYPEVSEELPSQEPLATKYGETYRIEPRSDETHERHRALLLMELHDVFETDFADIEYRPARSHSPDNGKQTPKSNEFNLYEGWVRHPEGDQPKLKSSCNDVAIPEQVCFLTPNGTEVQLSVDHAKTHGLIDQHMNISETLYEYGMNLVTSK